MRSDGESGSRPADSATTPTGNGSGPDAAQPRPQTDLSAFLTLDAGQVLERLRSGPQGLHESDARQRLREFGPNSVAREAQKSSLVQLLRRLGNPLNILLLTLAAVSLATGNFESAIIILLMVVLSVSFA